MKGIVCTGSIALDTTRTPFRTIEKALGGAASFFAYCSTFFSPTAIISAVGGDFPQEYWNLLENKGIDLSGVQKKENERTFFIDWNYDYDLYARKTNKLELNTFATFSPVVPEALKKAEYAYLGTCLPSQQLKLLEQLPSRRFSLMDTIEYYIEHDRENLLKTIAAVDGLLVNDIEARMLTKQNNLFKAAKEMMKLGPTTIIIKKGENGAILFHEKEALPFPAYPLEDVVDPTGAGDSFAGGFMGHLARKGKTDLKSMREAMAYATVMGSFAVEGFGLEALLKLDDKRINERFKHYCEMLNFQGG